MLHGFRDQTIDIDIKLDPEPKGIFEAIARIKDELDVNIELAAPDEFVPPLPGWKERSPLIRKVGKVEFRHYDYFAQALAKIERGSELDNSDVQSLVGKGLVQKSRFVELFRAVEPELIRYPAVDARDLARKVEAFAREE